MSWRTFFFSCWCSVIFLTLHLSIAAQHIDCKKAEKILCSVQKKIPTITTTDPELISLHYIFVNEMLDQLKDYQNNYLPQLHFCPDLDFYQQKYCCDTLLYNIGLLKDTLEIQRKRVDTIFYLQAEESLMMEDTFSALYYLERALQFNTLNTPALLLQLQLMYEQSNFQECIKIIHILYNEAPLCRSDENRLSDFTMQFYDKLFTTGDSLVKMGAASEALSYFELLETFCHNMPTAYCNDDYYHGIIRSKTGVYESYITIAKVALERKNYDLCYKFLDYADLYFMENKDVVEPTELFLTLKKQLENQRSSYQDVPSEEEEVVENKPVQVMDSVALKPDTIEPLQTKIQSPLLLEPEKCKELELQYNHLLIDILFHCLDEKYNEAWNEILKAKELEKYNCFKRDVRLEQLYQEFLLNNYKQ